MLFAPYAEHLAKRAAAQKPKNLLEIAAGTGIVTRALYAVLPGATIVATDSPRRMRFRTNRRAS